MATAGILIGGALACGAALWLVVVVWRLRANDRLDQEYRRQQREVAEWLARADKPAAGKARIDEIRRESIHHMRSQL